MHLLRRIGHYDSPAGAPLDPSAPGPVDRTTPGLAALLERVGRHGGYAVLDLGPGVGSSLRAYSRFARWVRFADLLAATSTSRQWAARLDALPSNPERPYDLVIGWDILDRLSPSERPHLVQRLTGLTGPASTLFLVARSGDAPANLLPYALSEGNQLRFALTNGVPPLHPILVPAEVSRLLAPFGVRRAFSSRLGLREYIAVRERN